MSYQSLSLVVIQYRPLPTYYTFVAFNRAYRLGSEIETSSDVKNVFVLGASNGKRNVLLLANTGDKDVTINLELHGADGDVVRIDGENLYTITGETTEDAMLTIPSSTCAEIDF